MAFGIFSMPSLLLYGQDYQPWGAVDPFIGPTIPGRLFTSSNLDMILYSGFICEENGCFNRYIAGFNDNQWYDISADSAGSGYRDVVDFEQGILISDGTTPYIGTQHIPYIAYFDGSEWTYPWIFNGGVMSLEWVNDTLHALGAFTEIDGNPAYHIARLVDGEWEGLVNPDIGIQFALYGDMEYYQGQYYVAGNILMEESWPSDLVILEDGEFIPVGDGILGGTTSVGSLEVFQDELYIAGQILVAEGNVGNHIIKWDGENFSPVGDLLYWEQGVIDGFGGIGELQVYEDHLYASGAFNFIGEESIARLARWDGEKWCGYETSVFDRNPSTFEVFDDKILALFHNQEYDGSDFPEDTANSFWLLDDYNLVTSCTEPLTAIETEENYSFAIYPNPSNGLITLESEKPIQRLAVFDALGKLVYQENVQSQTQVQVNLGHLPHGLYLIQVEGDGVVASRKVVLE